MMSVLLSEPEKMERLRLNRSEIPAAAAEVLRWDGPVPVIPKVARQDIEIKYGLIQAKGRGTGDLSATSLKDLQKADYGKEETKK